MERIEGMIFAPSDKPDRRIQRNLNFRKGASRLTGNIAAWSFVNACEMVRWMQVNESGREFSAEINNGYVAPRLPDGKWKELMQNVGDFYDGYSLAFIGWYIMSTPPFNKTPEGLRAAAAALIASAVVVSTELGIHPWSHTADKKDIPAGVIGAFLFASLNYGLGKWVDRGIDKSFQSGRINIKPKI